jgi:hypothetical protein
MAWLARCSERKARGKYGAAWLALFAKVEALAAELTDTGRFLVSRVN